MKRSGVTQLALMLSPVVVTLLFATLILLAAGANPLEAFGNILAGAFGSAKKWGDIAVVMVPLALCAAGMLVTFAAGLWNIGVEGQIVAGALAATWVALGVQGPPWLILPLTLLAGAAGGAVLGVVIGALRTWGRVNEIFAGLGMNFVMVALTNYLIFGPWRPPDGATMSGTEPFPLAARMPMIGSSRASLVSIGLAVAALVIVYFLLGDTHWGLRLKAIGLNSAAAARMGINTHREMIVAFVVCGLMAGIAGSLQTTAVYFRLIPQVSGGYGYLSQLVVLLSGLRAVAVPLIVFFFGAVQVGSPRLELRMQLDSSLGGILQASMVLFFFLIKGWRQRLADRKERNA